MITFTATSASQILKCPDCQGPVTEFVWPIYLCLVCHRKRTEKHGQTARQLLRQLREISPSMETACGLGSDNVSNHEKASYGSGNDPRGGLS